MFNLFRKNTEPLRDQAVRLIATETASSHGLDADQSNRIGNFAVGVLNRRTTSMEALVDAERLTMSIVAANKAEERHGNIGLVPLHRFQRLNDRDRPHPEPVEVE